MPDESQTHQIEEEISLLDIGVILARKRRLIVRTAVVFTLIGLVAAIAAAPEYRASMTVMSELSSDPVSGGGLGATLRSFGFSIPGVGSGGTLSAQAIPDMVDSRPVRLAVARDTFYFPKMGGEATLVEYLGRGGFGLGTITAFLKDYTIGLPGKILRLFRESPTASSGGESPFLTEAEDNALEWLAVAVNVNEDVDSGLITISANVDDPRVAAQLVSSVAEKLRIRVQEVYTNKTRQTLEFVEDQFNAAREELTAADRALAAFQDRNLDVRSNQVNLEVQRLQREVTFKSQLYTELQAQLTQARIELQKSEPVITSIDEPLPPLRPSGPNRKLMVVVALLLGVFAGMGLAFAVAALERGREDPENRTKLDEIRSAIPKLPRFLRRG